MTKGGLMGAGKPGSKAGMIARAQAAEPKNPGRGTSVKRATGPEMKSGGLSGGIAALRKDHSMRGANAPGKMPK